MGGGVIMGGGGIMGGGAIIGGGGGAGWMTVTLMVSCTAPAALAAVRVMVFVSVMPGASGVPEITAVPLGITVNFRPAGSAPDSVTVAAGKPVTAMEVLVNTPALALMAGWLANWGSCRSVRGRSWAVCRPWSRMLIMRL